MKEIFMFFRNATDREMSELFGVGYYEEIFDKYSEIDIIRMIADYIKECEDD